MRTLLHRKTLIPFFLITNLFLLQVVFGQVAGDYRSVASGDWKNPASWQYYNGTIWVTPSGTSPQGYPGQFVNTASVIIQANHLISIDASGINTKPMSTITINGALVLNGDNTSGGINYFFNTKNMIVTSGLTPTAVINFQNKVNLKLPVASALLVTTGGLVGDCSNNQQIFIGTTVYSYCNGGGASLDFNDIMNSDGTLNTTVSSNSPICSDETINLTGGITNSGWTSLNYNWSIIDPSGVITTYSAQNLGIPNGISGTYAVSLTVTANYGSLIYSNTEITSVIVNSLVNNTTSGFVGSTFCAGEQAKIKFDAKNNSGVLPYTISYKNDTTSSILTATITTDALIELDIVPNPTTDTHYTLISITDANGCSRTIDLGKTGAQIKIDPLPSAPAIGTTTQPTCNQPTGSVVLNGLPSTGTWTLNRMGSSSDTTTGTGTSTTISGLAVGSYTFTVSNGTCTSPASASVTINPLTINTYTTSWDNGVPNSNQTLVFNEAYISSGSIEGCSCIANADVTFTSGHTLTLTNEISVANLKNVVFEDGASLVQINNVANSGDIQYKRTTSSRVSDYTYVSSPVYSLVLPQTLGDLVSPTGTFYSYEVTSSDEYWEKRAATDAMDIGKGYIVAPSLEIPVGTPPKSPFDLFFLGVPNNGHYEISGIFADKSYLLGNPYPSAINADSFLTANSGVLDGTLYFWTHSTAIQETANITDGTAGTGAYAYTSNDYASYNITGGVGVATGNTIPGPPPTEDITNKPNGYIAAGQGFFASSKGAPTDSKIVFDNNMRVASTVLANGTGANQQFFKTRLPKTETVKSIEKNRIWLNLTNAQGAFKQTLVGYITNATNDYDSGFDGESFDGNAYVDFYSINQDKNLTIQGRALPFDTNDEVPLGYKSTISGAFTINIEQVDGFLTNQDVFLEDKLTNTLVDLKSGSYTFSTVPGTFNDRFVLRYTNKTLGTNDFNTTENKVLVSCKNKQITINSFAETLHKVVIYDLLGKQLYQKNKVNSNALLLANLNCSPQTLIVKTSLKNGETRTDKVIFQ